VIIVFFSSLALGGRRRNGNQATITGIDGIYGNRKQGLGFRDISV
jgi:hypothetical protein